MDVFDGHAESFRDEVLVASRVEDAGHADDAVGRETRLVQHHVAHGVERVADADEDGVGRLLDDLLGDRTDDLAVGFDELIAAGELARGGVFLTGNARGDHHHVRACGRVVVVGSDQVRVEAHDGRALGEVECLALREALFDVDQDDVAQLFLNGPVSSGRAHVASSDDGDLVPSRHGCSPGLCARSSTALGVRGARETSDLGPLSCWP